MEKTADNNFYFHECMRYREYFNVMLQWTLLLQKGIKIDEYLSSKGYKSIVIYGMSDIGNCLAGELLESKQCELLYTIDQGTPKLYYDVKCYRLNELNGLDKPDIIIITLPHIYEKIKNDVGQKIDCKIQSITELVYDAYYSVEVK